MLTSSTNDLVIEQLNNLKGFRVGHLNRAAERGGQGGQFAPGPHTLWGLKNHGASQK